MYENDLFAIQIPLDFSALTNLSWLLLPTVTTVQLGKGGAAAAQTP